MRSLTFKLFSAFLAITLTMAILGTVIVRYTTQKDFAELVLNNALDTFTEQATAYYQINGSWRGFRDYVRDLRQQSQQPLPQNSPNAQQPQAPPAGQLPRPPALSFALVDVDGRVALPSQVYRFGELLPEEALEEGSQIELNGQVIGTVLTTGETPPLDPKEQQYLERTNRSLLYATLGAAAVALLLSLMLTRGLTRPLRELTGAIQATATGEFGQQVGVHSRDEIGQLASAFNQMSADLAHLSQQRRQMTADIAHDLRTPLTVIGGYVESMRDGVLKPSPERLDTIQSEVHHLQRLVEDLRTLSLADAGELSLNLAPVDPAALLKQIEATYQHPAERQKIALTIAAAPELPTVNIDPDRMMQVLGNLVSNALRYTPEGGKIAVRVAKGVQSKRGAGSGETAIIRHPSSVIFTVTDTGTGINPADISRIFDRFYRGDGSRHGESGETGLGLAIAKSIIEMHGGQIGVESELGRGSSFKIWLPLGN